MLIKPGYRYIAQCQIHSMFVVIKNENVFEQRRLLPICNANARALRFIHGNANFVQTFLKEKFGIK